MARLGSPLRRRLKRLALAAAAALAALAGGLLVLDRLYPPDLTRYRDLSVTVLAADGSLLRAFPASDERWRFEARPKDVAPLALAMLKAYEDKRFDSHPGVDPLALGRAVGQLAASGRAVSGASTLTMQAARLLEPRPRTIPAKLVEMLRALQLEAHYSKDDILSIYLTLAPYGGNLEGIRAASLAWFGKEPRHLTAAEAALLVALPQSPTRLRPDRASDAARARRDRVLRLMAEAGVLPRREAEEAMAAPMPTRRRPLPVLSPQLAERLKAENPGLREIRSTIDPGLQQAVGRVVEQQLARAEPALNAAVLVIDNRDLSVIAALGSRDWIGGPPGGMIDLTRAVRSPGSTLKPFIYGLALDRLIVAADTLIDDVPTRFGSYAPGNFDGRWHGTITIRDALQHSYNIPAVALLDRIGPLGFVRALEAAGARLVQLDGAAAPSLPIALGGIGIRLEDLVMLYAGLARGGTTLPLRWTASQPAGAPRPLIGPGAAWQIARILEGAPPPANFPLAEISGRRVKIAYKTGTSYGYRDAWAVGYTRQVTVGVWVGRADGASCAGCFGLAAAAPILLRIFDLIPPDPLAGEIPPPPKGVMTGPNGALPASLRHFVGRSDLLTAGAAASRENGPRIAFPIDGSEIELPRLSDGSLGTINLVASGGRRPYRWLIDGLPRPGESWRLASPWVPGGAGFVRLQVIDADGRSSSVGVFIKPSETRSR